jgi:hypothetical protein
VHALHPRGISLGPSTGRRLCSAEPARRTGAELPPRRCRRDGIVRNRLFAHPDTNR